ncbi:MAG: proteinral secretion pathway protein N [Comamonadaceae bacterium]|nr:MAG: proteinral secretion pathway protein N [Comamonadaceae bacterium]
MRGGQSGQARHWSGLLLQLNTSCCLAQPWRVALMPRWGGFQVTLSDSPSTWPAQLLSGLGTPFNTMAPQGQLALSTQGLSLTWAAGRLQVAGQTQLQLQDLSSRLSTLSPMGSYRFTLTGGSAPELLLVTLKGPLQLSGRGQWVGGKLRFAGEASSTPEHLSALSNLLNIIGRRDGARSVINLG